MNKSLSHTPKRTGFNHSTCNKIPLGGNRTIPFPKGQRVNIRGSLIKILHGEKPGSSLRHQDFTGAQLHCWGKNLKPIPVWWHRSTSIPLCMCRNKQGIESDITSVQLSFIFTCSKADFHHCPSTAAVELITKPSCPRKVSLSRSAFLLGSRQSQALSFFRSLEAPSLCILT